MQNPTNSQAEESLFLPSRTFSRLMCNRFLWDFPEHDVYTLIIDAYRLRMDDFPRFDNVSQMRAVIYGGQDLDARGGLERFIHLAGKRPGILPPWWDSSKEEMCLKLAMGGITEDELPGLPKNTRKWLNMSKRPTVDKAELISHYGDSYFPMKLRLLTDVIYSCSLGNNDGTPLKRMRAQLEQKEDSDQAIWDTIIDARTGEMTSRNHAKGTFH